jgi:hypothetical protein
MPTLFGLISLACLLHRPEHILNNFLRVTKNHHGFIQIEEFIV